MSTATPQAPPGPKLLTAEEFANLPEPPDGSLEELVKGVVVTTSLPGFRHGKMQGRIALLLDQHVRQRRLGQVVLRTGVITERDPDSVRGPDVVFWGVDRLPIDFEPEVYADVAADLCVEVLSPGERPGRVRNKLQEYSPVVSAWSGSSIQRIAA